MSVTRIAVASALLLVVTAGGVIGISLGIAAEQRVQKVKDAITKVAPEFVVDDVQPAPFPGFYQAAVGAQVIYVSEDGTHVIEGEAIEVATNKNVTKPVIQKLSAAMLDEAANSGLHYAAKGERKGTIYVFTDPGCGYCRKFHEQLPELTSKGVEVVYMAFPRGGLRTPDAGALGGVLCSQDKQAEMDRAIHGSPGFASGCDGLVSRHYRLGMQLGIQGTPGIFAADGRQIGGYLTAEEVLSQLSTSAEQSG